MFGPAKQMIDVIKVVIQVLQKNNQLPQK